MNCINSFYEKRIAFCALGQHMKHQFSLNKQEDYLQYFFQIVIFAQIILKQLTNVAIYISLSFRTYTTGIYEWKCTWIHGFFFQGHYLLILYLQTFAQHFSYQFYVVLLAIYMDPYCIQILNNAHQLHIFLSTYWR